MITVIAALKSESANVALFVFVKGPDHNAIAERTELYPSKPAVTR